MTELERRYRRLLRLLPASYRQVWEQDMVATFLAGALPADSDDAEFAAEHGRPDWAEVGSVVALAVRLRLGGVGAPPRSLAWGDAVRRVALVGLLVNAVGALAGVASLFWQPLRFPDLPIATRSVTVWTLLGLGWVAAYVALVIGHRRAARQFAGLSLLPTVITTAVDLAATGGAYLASHTVELLMTAVPVLALSAFHRDAPPVRSRPWLVALPVGVALVTGVLLLTQAPGRWVLVDFPGLACAATIAATLGYWVTSARAASWLITLALLAVGALGLRVVTLLDYLQFTTSASGRNPLITAAIVETGMVLVLAVPLVIFAIRALRKLPIAGPTTVANQDRCCGER